MVNLRSSLLHNQSNTFKCPLCALPLSPGQNTLKHTMSRPRTPATTSDTFSDPGSLSDLESGWTDLSSNRSGGRLRTFSINDDPSDDENMFEERPDEETWEGILHSDNELDQFAVGENTLVSEYLPNCPPLSTRSVPAPDAADLQSSASIIAVEDAADSSSSSQCSIRSSRAALRLSFPDPLSDSREDTLSPCIVHAKLDEGNLEQTDGADASKDHFSSSFVNAKEAAGVDDKNMSPISEDGSSPRFAIILLGYNPLRYIKSSLLDFLSNAVATSLEGSPILSNDLQLSRTFRVPLRRRLVPGQNCSGPDVDDYIFISDRTNSLDARPLEALTCPTLVVVFLQPPNCCPKFPELPANVKFLPILLDSLANDSISSLLDLSPSMLFDSTHSGITLPGGNSYHREALQQCKELNILESHIYGGSPGVLTVEQLISSSRDFSTALTDAFFQSNTHESIKEKSYGSTLRPIIILSTILFSIVFILANIMTPLRSLSLYPTRHIPIQDAVHTLHVSMAKNMAKTLGATIRRYEFKSLSVPDPTTVCLSHTRTHTSNIRAFPATLDPSPPILTLDPPLIKALTLAPAKSVIKTITAGAESMTGKSDSLAIRLTSALTPLFDAVGNDMRDLLEAIDVLLRAVRNLLEEQVIRGFGEIVDVIKEQANHGIKDLSNKVSSAVHSLSELAYYRHAKAQDNARQMKTTGEHFINVAKQRFGSRWTRARSNACKALNGGLSAGRLLFNSIGEADFKGAQEPRRQRWQDSWNQRAQCGF